MSLFNIRAIREISNDPLTKFVNYMAKKASKNAVKDAVDKLEDKEDIYSDGKDLESVLRIHDDLQFANKFVNLLYFPITEPDLSLLTLWIRGRNMGNTMTDLSGFANPITLNGDPILVDGSPFDDGINVGGSGTKSVALRFNRPTSDLVNQEDIRVADNIRIDSGFISTGISYFIRFRLHSLAQQGGSNIRIFEKSDDNSYVTDPRDGAMLCCNNAGALTVTFMRADAKTEKTTSDNPIIAGTVYDLWITRNQSNGEVKMFINNVQKTLNNSSNNHGWHSPESDTDLSIFSPGGTATYGHAYGDLYDFRIYREKIITSDTHGSSLFFDGINDSVDCGNHSDLWSQGLTKFSFSFWVYPTTALGNNRICVAHDTANVAHAFKCEIQSTVPRIDWIIRDAANVAQIAQATPTLNAWNHFTCTYDNSLGSQNIKIYKNAVLGGVTDTLTETINLSGNLRLGGPSDDLEGYMKDFRWWTRKALTQQQITDVMNNSYLAPTPDYWQLLTIGSGTLLDIIGQIKTAGIGGSVWVNDEVGNHFTNKWTVAGIPFGQCMIPNYWSSFQQVVPTFLSSSFTSTSFTMD